MTGTNFLNTRGILKPGAVAKKFSIRRYEPAPQLAYFIERYWLIDWDLRGEEPYLQDTLPYPCVNAVLEANNSQIYGVVTGKFTRRLEGAGRVYGIKFRPGGFFPFWQRSVAQLGDRAIPFEAVFGAESQRLEKQVLSLDEDAAMVQTVEAFLRARLPEPDAQVAEVDGIVKRIEADPSMRRVEDVAAVIQRSPRSLQRLFRQYVGVSPKWVIQRYRLQEAAEQIAGGDVGDWSRMAQGLGYFDQAHFIKDFKAIIGSTPAEYARAAQEMANKSSRISSE